MFEFDLTDTEMSILCLIDKKGRSVREISWLLDIPTVTCYRGISYMLTKDLVQINGTALTRDGKRYTKYLSNVSSYSIHLENGNITKTLRLKNKEKPIIVMSNPAVD